MILKNSSFLKFHLSFTNENKPVYYFYDVPKKCGNNIIYVETAKDATEIYNKIADAYSLKEKATVEEMEHYALERFEQVLFERRAESFKNGLKKLMKKYEIDFKIDASTEEDISLFLVDKNNENNTVKILN